MTDTDFGEELHDALDEALSLRGVYLLFALAGAALSVIWFLYLVREPPEDARGYVATLFPAVMGWFLAWALFSKRLSDKVMPVILSAVFGMTYRPKAHGADIDILVALGLLPSNGRKTPQAEAIGRVRGRLLRVWGVITVSRRRRATATYSAYVCEFAAKPEWSGLTLVPEDFPRWLRSALDFSQAGTVAHPPLRKLAALRLYRTADGAPPLGDLMLRIGASNRLFRDQAAFAGIHYGDDRTLMVIRDTSLPMRIFGLFKSRDRIIADLSHRLEELSLPLRLAEIWELDSADSGSIKT